jgi:hypothetical protein
VFLLAPPQAGGTSDSAAKRTMAIKLMRNVGRSWKNRHMLGRIHLQPHLSVDEIEHHVGRAMPLLMRSYSTHPPRLRLCSA